jgi:hypothetical protein
VNVVLTIRHYRDINQLTNASGKRTYEGDLAEVYLQCLNNHIDPHANLGVSIGGVLVGGKGFRFQR